MTPYEQELRNNKSISTQRSQLPNFPGRFLAFNGQTGNLGIFIPGNFDQIEKIDSIRFIVYFVMTRMAYHKPDGTTERSSYVIASSGDEAGADTPYQITVDGVAYQGFTKRELIDRIGIVNPKDIKRETIYVGYLVNINGEKANTAEPIWFVSRGTNEWLLNEAIKQDGGISQKTMIQIRAEHKIHENENGGKSQVATFNVSELPDEKITGFAEYVNRDGMYDLLSDYKNKMAEAIKKILANGNQAQIQPKFEETQSVGQVATPFDDKEAFDISDDDLPF
ncbi:hypothetical protein [Pediococcus pentosaceus]|uniref:hypothetical protein n=1 Tax=Pediococcus pentosaceus TaxID=1255 RepID=UPI003981C3E1